LRRSAGKRTAEKKKRYGFSHRRRVRVSKGE
jgi:hypothetical protein